MLVLLEPKMVEKKTSTKTLKFDSQLESGGIRCKWGIVIMWKEETLKLDIISITPHGAQVMVKLNFNPKSWLFFFFLC